jgi:two-component system, cell cycle response regulator
MYFPVQQKRFRRHLMKHKALIIESSRVFRLILKKIMDASGVECNIYASAKEAMEDVHGEYTFIVVARTLEEISGEIFLTHYGVKHGLGNALTILTVADNAETYLVEAHKAGFKLVFGKDNLGSLQDIVTNIINKLSLDLTANILLIEDSEIVSEMMADLLETNGSKVTRISNLKNLAEIFNENDFDLVISDYHLADSETGDDVINHIRYHEDDIKSNAPILIVSVEADQNKRISFLRNGANDIILKPYDNDELIVRSSNLIRTNRLLKKVNSQNQQLTELALTDQLSGLYNRHSLYDLAPKYISNARRSEAFLSLLVIDLDHFKNINDTHGHNVGDIVLKSVSAVLQSSCRVEDMVARFGGEEFVMLLANCNLENAAVIADRLRKAIESIQPEGLVVTSSIGVSELHSQDQDFDSLFERADKAVYEAKKTGRNKVVCL